MTVETDKLQVQDCTELFEDPDGNGIFRNTDTGVSLTLDQVAKLSGGRVEIPDGNLRLGTGQAIEDGGGNSRFVLASDRTSVYDGNSNKALQFLEGNSYQLNVYSGTPLDISDQEGGFTAAQYTTSASAPGTLSLDNANLDAGGNNITNAGSVSTSSVDIEFSGDAQSPHGLTVLDNSTDNSEQIAIESDPQGSTELVFQPTDGSYKWGFRGSQDGNFYLDNHDNLTSRLRFIKQGSTDVLNSDLNVVDGDVSADSASITNQVDAGSVNAGKVTHTFNQSTKHTSEKRPLYTTEDKDIYMATDGDDSNPGTQAEPIATLGEFMDRLPPYILHQRRLLIEPGTYGDGSVAWGLPWHALGGVPHTDPLSIRSTTGTASDVVLKDVPVTAFVTNEADDAQITDLTIDKHIINAGGSLHVANVTFTGNEDTTGIAHLGHSQYYTQFQNCDFGDENYAKVANGLDGARLHISGCNGIVSEYVADPSKGGIITSGGGGTLWGKHGYINPQRKSGVIFANRKGELWGMENRLWDDWGDARLTERFRGGSGAGYRPEWNTLGGSPSAVDGAAVLPAGNSTTQKITTPFLKSRMTTGRFRFEYELQSDPTAGKLIFYPIRNDSSNYWRVDVANDGSLQVVKNQAGSASFGVINGSVTDDTNRHVIEMQRKLDVDNNGNEGWELFVDGSSQGTATDSYVPQPTHRRFDSTLDAEIQLHHYQEISLAE